MTECRICKGPTLTVKSNGDEFKVCEKCNPTRSTGLDIAGCEIVCIMCRDSVEYDADAGNRCCVCGKFICADCESDCYQEEGLEDGSVIFTCENCDEDY